jgi:hypothetical protein
MAIHPSVRIIGALKWYSELTGLRIAEEAWISNLSGLQIVTPGLRHGLQVFLER